jgi:hypothetical protein
MPSCPRDPIPERLPDMRIRCPYPCHLSMGGDRPSATSRSGRHPCRHVYRDFPNKEALLTPSFPIDAVFVPKLDHLVEAAAQAPDIEHAVGVPRNSPLVHFPRVRRFQYFSGSSGPMWCRLWLTLHVRSTVEGHCPFRAWMPRCLSQVPRAGLRSMTKHPSHSRVRSAYKLSATTPGTPRRRVRDQRATPARPRCHTDAIARREPGHAHTFGPDVYLDSDHPDPEHLDSDLLVS